MKLFVREKKYTKKTGEVSTYFTIQATKFFGSFPTRAKAEEEKARLQHEADAARRRGTERDAAEERKR